MLTKLENLKHEKNDISVTFAKKKSKMTKYFTLILLPFLLLIVISCGPNKKKEIDEVVSTPEPTILFDIAVDSFLVLKEKIGRNQNLSDILLAQNVSYQQISQLVEIAKPVFDVRKINVGNTYYLIKEQDTLQKLRYFIYEKNRVEYVVIDLSERIKASAGRKEIVRVLDTIEGTITSSLWNSMVENKVNPELANELSDIYSWTIDFFGIQKGDNYRIYYEKLVVDKDTFGIGRVYAARFNHLKTDYNSFYFIQDSIGEYFDENGKSLRKTFLKAPLKFNRVSSRFSHGRMHPVLKIVRPHHGVDYAASAGTPVLTIGDGVVVARAYQSNGGGNYVTVKHNGTYSTTYMHLQGYAKDISVGKTVKQGDVIGYVGSTGLSTGPHLDFRVYKNGQPIDPLKLKSPSAEPVKPNYLIQFNHLKDSLSKILYPIKN